ncbi:MAG: hypothetical protein ACLFWF_03010 [Alphaproteobacteria bacterium]
MTGTRTSRPLREGETPSTAERVRALARPGIYPRPPERVEVRETHMSWVFLAGDHVYKLKKPVKTPVLDFSTLQAREVNALREVRLNRRLAPGVYYGVVPLTQERAGRLALDGGGRVIDWLVHMRRLPETAMLDHLIENGAVPRDRIDALGHRLAAFYRRAARADISPTAYAARFGRELEESREVLLHSPVSLDSGTAPVLDRAEAALRHIRPLLEERVRGGHVVDGHGDLRPEHVCLLDPPVVIDCLEFNRELRLVDPFDELAFLGFECTRLGAPWVRGRLIELCAQALGGRPPEPLIAFYTAFRGLVRARLALAHLLEPDPATPEKWRPRALEYVRIAAEATPLPPEG